MNVNLKNIALKTFWTAVAAGLSYLTAEVAEWDAATVPVMTAALTYLLALVREQLGRTTPDLPPPAPSSGSPLARNV